MRVEQVFITPLVLNDTYGDEIDVSDYVKIDGLAKIKRSIDSTDYSVGVYRFSDLRLKCQNALGTFNENDSRSIFPFTRDRAKVRVIVLDINSNSFETETQVQFEGLINDEATRQNITNDVITFKALSKDSVFRTTRVPAGIISVGTAAKTAIVSMLSQPSIENLLTVDADNIAPELNFEIDTPGELDNLEVREALDFIMAASGSVLLIEDDIIYVHGRERPDADPENPLELRGRGEISNNANIISISEYNSGKQRQFNSVRLNDGAVTVEDSASVFEFGLRQIEFDFPMVNILATLRQIGEAIAEEFQYPKIELKLRVPTSVANGALLLDLVRVDAPWLLKPLAEKFFPIYGTATYGDAITPYPEIFGSVQITSNLKFKIISIEDYPKTFITTLKLRQSGKFPNDGDFIATVPAIYGIAQYSQSRYGVI